MRKAWIAVIIPLLACGCGHAVAETAARPPSGKPTPDSAAAVRSLALKAAAANGDRSPRRILWVASTRKKAVELTGGDIVNTDQPVILIEVVGHFVDQMARVPLGASPPNGSVICLIVDAASSQGLDFGLGNTTYNLSALGKVNEVAP